MANPLTFMQTSDSGAPSLIPPGWKNPTGPIARPDSVAATSPESAPKTGGFPVLPALALGGIFLFLVMGKKGRRR